MIPGGWHALLVTLPLLGPGGWTRFGVAPPGRDAVVLDPLDCRVRVGHVDLDAGPGRREVRVARTWDGAWRTDGIVALSSYTRADAAGRVGEGEAWVEARGGGEELRGVNQDGVEVRWRWEGERLLGYTDPAGVRTTYTYGADGALASLAWPDGSGVQLAPGRITGSYGTWTCEKQGARSVLTDPSGARWRVELVGDERVLFDPTGAIWKTQVVDGRLMGWTDALGRVVRLERSTAGALIGMGVGEDRWTFPGGATGVLSGPGGARWSIERGPAGAITRIVDGAGRMLVLEPDGLGRLRNVWRGGGGRVIGRDGLGRVISEQPPGSMRLDAARDGLGRVTRITDASGVAWGVARDAGGRVVGLTDPAGGTWALVRDRVGRVLSVTDPRGVVTRAERRADGRITAVERAPGGRWELRRGADGRVTALRDDGGHQTGWIRDAVGRVSTILRADGSSILVRRDANGEIVGIGALRVDRDPAGRPRAVGAGAGRVVAVSGPGAVRIRRDAGGAPVEVAAEGSDGVRIDRDLRGMVARLRAGGGDWRLRRDSAGRLLGVSAGKGIELGVDRDAAGRPSVIRFADGWLARLSYEGSSTSVRVLDGEGMGAGSAGWVEDAAGRLVRRIAEAEWVYRRDPLGTLAAMESVVGAWSRAPDRVEGPAGYEARLTPDGRPLAVTVGGDGPAPYGLGARSLTYRLGAAREVEGVQAGAASLAFTYDGLGRLASAGGEPIRRDALGNLTGVGVLEVLGYGSLLRVGDEPRAGVPGVAWARRGGGLVLDRVGAPLLSLSLGPLASAPTGRPSSAAAAETGPGGRLQVPDGGPLLGRLEALDPFTGLPLGPTWRWPWEGDAWEVASSPSVWAEPDEWTDGLAWDPAPFAPRLPDPLLLLVMAGEIEGEPGSTVEPPGLPFLPASFAAARPPMLPDPEHVRLDDDPLVEHVWRSVPPPFRPLQPDDVARLTLGAELAEELEELPGMDLGLPSDLLP